MAVFQSNIVTPIFGWCRFSAEDAERLIPIVEPLVNAEAKHGLIFGPCTGGSVPPPVCLLPVADESHRLYFEAALAASA